MHDRDVRKALHEQVLQEQHDDPGTLVLDELGLRHGSCRVDIAVVSNHIHGYEIKSDKDTLTRLPAQVITYSEVLDRATLIVGEKYAEKCLDFLPEWWGIEVATMAGKEIVAFETVRQHRTNPAIDKVALAELLWRPEVVTILRTLAVAEAVLRKPRAVLYKHLAEMMDLDQLRAVVRQTLKSRASWRGQQLASSSDTADHSDF